MNTEQQRRAEELFQAALQRTPAERERFLMGVCGADATLREEVLSLLAHHEAGRGFLEGPAVGGLPDASSFEAAAAFEEPSLPPGQQIGSYRIVELLGRGGMGIVYRAEQQQPRRVVALKVIKPGIASPAALRRFGHEVQVLGRLQHPGIAQIFDAGTADTGHGPQPFFAMELVIGRPLTEYAHAKRLGSNERLELLASVCMAVQHAHQRGVIHRDLKPGNILVAEEGAEARKHKRTKEENTGHARPKILDFGVARATDADVQATTLRTDIGQLIGTIPYMSPEQVSGDPAELDTRSDVYALGVIAYELLTGRPPYDLRRKPVPEAVRVIREEEPRPLSSVSKVFRGDIETIVAKALEKDKERRYQSAADLAADIARYLRDEPIVARPASAAYQLRKFARRNKVLVGSVVVVMLVLALAAAGMTHWAFRAARQGRRAEREARTAQAISDFLGQMFVSIEPEVARGHEVTVREVLEQSASEVGTALAEEPEVAATLHHTIGATYQALGLPAEAEPHLRAAVELRHRHLGDDGPRTLRSAAQLAQVLLAQHELAEAEPLMQETLAARRRALGEQHPDTLASMVDVTELYRRQGKLRLAEEHARTTLDLCRDALDETDRLRLGALINLGVVLHDAGKLDEAEELLRTAWRLQGRALGEEHPQTLTSMNGLADLLRAQGKLAEAEALLVRVLDSRRRVLGEAHPSTLAALNNLALVLRMQNRLEDAEPLYRQALELTRQHQGNEHPQTLAVMNNLGALLIEQGRLNDAEQFARETLEIRRRVLGPEHPRTLSSMNNLSSVLYRQGKVEESTASFREILDIHVRTVGETHPNTLTTMANLVAILLRQGLLDEAEELCRRAVPASREALGTTHPNTILAQYDFAKVLVAQREFQEATGVFEELVAAAAEAPPPWPTYIPVFRGGQGKCLTRLGRYEEAERHLLAAYRAQVAAAGDEDEDAQAFVAWLIELYEAWGKPEQAATWRAKQAARTTRPY